MIASWRLVLVYVWSGGGEAAAAAEAAFSEESWQLIGGFGHSEQAIAANSGVQLIEWSVYGKASCCW